MSVRESLSNIGSRISLQATMCAVALIVIAAPLSARAQDFCRCGDCCGPLGGCPSTGSKREITNLKDKIPELVLCAKDVADCRQIWEKKLDPFQIVDINTLQEAIDEIIAAFNSWGFPLNVVIDGHGNPGIQSIGVWGAANCIGNNDPGKCPNAQANKDKFVNAVAGMIKDLTLLGCSVGDTAKGRDFVEKLRGALGANSVHAFTETVSTQKPANNKYWTTDGTKSVPAMPVWGLVGLAVLLAAGGAILFARRRAPVTD